MKKLWMAHRNDRRNHLILALVEWMNEWKRKQWYRSSKENGFYRCCWWARNDPMYSAIIVFAAHSHTPRATVQIRFRSTFLLSYNMMQKIRTTFYQSCIIATVTIIIIIAATTFHRYISVPDVVPPCYTRCNCCNCNFDRWHTGRTTTSLPLSLFSTYVVSNMLSDSIVFGSRFKNMCG